MLGGRLNTTDFYQNTGNIFTKQSEYVVVKLHKYSINTICASLYKR